MHYKPIENYHVENVILGKDFNLGTIGSFFMLSPTQKLYGYSHLFNLTLYHAYENTKVAWVET
jgi:hypothetical protein